MTGRQAAEARRVRGYAMKYVNDSAEPPTDANLAEVLVTCARTPKAEWLPAIRAEVLAWREENGRLSRLETNGGVSGRLLPRKPATPDSSDVLRGGDLDRGDGQPDAPRPATVTARSDSRAAVAASRPGEAP